MVTAKRTSVALAESIMARFPDPDDIPFRPWCYVQGYVLSGLEMLYEYTAEIKYWNYVLRFVDQPLIYDVYINYPKHVNAKEAVGAVLWATAIVEKPHG